MGAKQHSYGTRFVFSSQVGNRIMRKNNPLQRFSVVLRRVKQPLSGSLYVSLWGGGGGVDIGTLGVWNIE
jgi:hypothetical protein